MISASTISGMIDERPEEGVFRVRRDMFIDPEIYELEMQAIFESSWVYLAHESQLPRPNDFLTGHIGRQPTLLTRQPDGSIRGFLNSCMHRGAMVENRASGNRKLFVCPFHSWSYRNDGTLVSCGDQGQAGYGSGFCKEELALVPIARLENYRGFVFGCLNENVMSLPDYLGEAKAFIDMVVDQDRNGELEIIPGPQVYTYDGNWKLQAENGVDGYHVNSIHGNYVATVRNREKIAGNNDVVKPVDVSGFGKLAGGYYAFENGHVVLWNELPNPEVRPSYACRDDYVKRCGEERAFWMANTWRNLFIFPNLLLMDQMSSQIRAFRPLELECTEVRAFAFAPKSEDPQYRPARIRQYEDFFSASGLATPDDLAAFNSSQTGFRARGAEWSDVSRGATFCQPGGNERSERSGFTPKFHGPNLQDEGLFLNQHKQWQKLLFEHLQARPAELAEAAE